MRPILIAIFMLLSNLVLSQDQKKIDSLKQLLPSQQDTIRLNSLFELFNLFVRDNPEKAKEYLDTLLIESSSKMPKPIQTQAILAEGIYFYSTNDYTLSEKSLLKSANIYEELNLKIPLNLNYLGIVQKYLGKLEKRVKVICVLQN